MLPILHDLIFIVTWWFSNYSRASPQFSVNGTARGGVCRTPVIDKLNLYSRSTLRFMSGAGKARRRVYVIPGVVRPPFSRKSFASAGAHWHAAVWLRPNDIGSFVSMEAAHCHCSSAYHSGVRPPFVPFRAFFLVFRFRLSEHGQEFYLPLSSLLLDERTPESGDTSHKRLCVTKEASIEGVRPP